MFPGAVDGDGFVLQSLDDKVGHHSAVVGVHPGAVGVEDPRHPHLHPGLLVVGVGQGLRHPLTFVVTSPGTDGVDVAPVGLWLGMDLRVAINLK